MSEAAKAKRKPKATRVRKKADVKVLVIPPDTEAYLEVDDLLHVLRVCRSTFKAMLADGEYPPPDSRIGNRDKWLVSTHNAWMRSRPKPEPAPNPFRRD